MCVCVSGLLYYTLGNLDPILRSTLKSIHLLSIAKYEVICKYGIDELLEPVITDVLKLKRVSIILIINAALLLKLYIRLVELNLSSMVVFTLTEAQLLLSLLITWLRGL